MQADIRTDHFQPVMEIYININRNDSIWWKKSSKKFLIVKNINYNPDDVNDAKNFIKTDETNPTNKSKKSSMFFYIH